MTNKANIVSFFAGTLLVFAYAPFNQWWLVFLALPAWLHQLHKATHPRQAFTVNFAFGLGWFVSGISWVHVSIADFGGMPLIISLLLMFLLCLYLALYPAFSGYLSVKLSQKLRIPNAQLWYLAPIWLLTEYLRGTLLTGFPWLSLGYSQINSPLKHLAPYIGEIGISFVILIICISFYQLTFRQHIKTAVSCIMLCGISIVASAHFYSVKPIEKQFTVSLIQGNIAQALKWLPEQEWPTMEKYLALSPFGKNVDLIVWPESAIPSMESSVQNYLHTVDELANSDNTALITGIIDYQYNEKAFYNNLIVLGNKTQHAESGSYQYNHTNRYSKYQLLPIGEFIPFGEFLRPLAPLFNLPMSSFSRGEYQQPNLVAKGVNILPLICFEIAFTEQLQANFSQQQQTTDLLLTVSNDAWFADSHGPHQHMEIARMRALEYGRPLIRSTNTGITAIVDHRGIFIAKSPQFEEHVLTQSISLVSGNTFFSIYGRSTIYIIAVLFFIVFTLGQRSNSNNQ